MSYTPSSNEVIISGLPISSGGTITAGIDVIIPLQVSDPSQFYVLSTDGTNIKVDPSTAAQLYATATAIREVNDFFGRLDVQNIPGSDWGPLLTSVAQVLTLQSASKLLADLIPDLLALVVAPPTEPFKVALTLDGAASTLIDAAARFGKAQAEVLLAYSVLKRAQNLLDNSYGSFQDNIQTAAELRQPIDFSSIQSVLTDTLASLNVGTAATQAISEVANLNNSLWDDILDFGKEIVQSSLGTFLGALAPIAGAVEGGIETDFDLVDDALDRDQRHTRPSHLGQIVRFG